LSNFIKYNFAQAKPNTVARVINSNPRMEEVMREYSANIIHTGAQNFDGNDEFQDGFAAGLDAEVVDIPEEPQASPEEYIIAAQEEAERILAQAQADAEDIINQANTQAMQMFEEQKSAGFAQGQQEAMQTLETQQAEMNQQLADLRQSLENEYLEKHSLMEEEIVDALAQVVEKNFGIFMKDYKETLVYLIQRTIYGIESSKTFKVRVSPENVSVVSEALQEFVQGLGSDITLDVAHDESLGETGCVIETEYGVYHCGIDLQLENLLSQMKALSQ